MGHGCHGHSTSPHQWGDDPAKWKGVIPELPPFQPPSLPGKAGDTKVALDYAAKFGADITQMLQKALTAKFGFLSHTTNNITPTGAYVLGNTYKIFLLGQTFIGELNKLSNHDPAARPKASSGDSDPADGTEDLALLAAFVNAIVQMDRMTLADERIPQDPTADGAPVQEYGDDGQPITLDA